LNQYTFFSSIIWSNYFGITHTCWLNSFSTEVHKEDKVKAGLKDPSNSNHTSKNQVKTCSLSHEDSSLSSLANL